MKKIISRARKLMALAENAGTEAEAMNATRKLHALMSKYNFDMTQVEKEETIDQDKADVRDAAWKRVIMSSIAKLYFCKMYYSKTTRNNASYFVVGEKMNREFALSMGLRVCETIRKEALKESKKIYGKKDCTFTRSFENAASHRIWERCEELIKKASDGLLDDDEGNTLPALQSTYDNKLTECNNWINERFNLINSKSRTRSSNVSGKIAGRAAADKIGLHKGIQSKNTPLGLS